MGTLSFFAHRCTPPNARVPKPPFVVYYITREYSCKTRMHKELSYTTWKLFRTGNAAHRNHKLVSFAALFHSARSGPRYRGYSANRRRSGTEGNTRERLWYFGQKETPAAATASLRHASFLIHFLYTHGVQGPESSSLIAAESVSGSYFSWELGRLGIPHLTSRCWRDLQWWKKCIAKIHKKKKREKNLRGRAEVVRRGK